LRRDEYLVILEFIVTHLAYIHPASAEIAGYIRARFSASRGIPNPYDIVATSDAVGHPLFVCDHKLLPTALETVFELITTDDVCAELKRALRRFYSRVSRHYDKSEASTDAASSVRRGVRNTVSLSKCVMSAIAAIGPGAVLAVRPCDVIVLVAAVWTRTAAREIKVPEFLRSSLDDALNKMCVFNHEDDRPLINIVDGVGGVLVDDVLVVSSVAMTSDQIRDAAFISQVRPRLRSFRIERADDDDEPEHVDAFELSMQFGEMRDVEYLVSNDREVLDRLNGVLAGYDIMVNANTSADLSADQTAAEPAAEPGQSMFKRRRPITDS
jgi:hypothetical protein